MKTIRKDNVVEDFFGVKVADPYRWLEDETLTETNRWTEEQVQNTESYLGMYEQRKSMKDTLLNLHNYEKYSLPEKVGDYYYFHKNTGLQNQAIFYRSKSLSNPKLEVVIDPNLLSADGIAAITSTSFNANGTLLAYAISHAGSDWQEVRIRNLETNEDYPEVLTWGKYISIAWHGELSGFYYNRYPNQDIIAPEDKSFFNRVYWHAVGTLEEEDILIYEEPDRKEPSFTPVISGDKRYLLLTIKNGTEPKNEIYYRELKDTGQFVPLIANSNAIYNFLGNDDQTFYFQTNDQADKGRVIAVDLENPEREHWKEILSEKDDPISFVKLMNDKFIVCSIHNVSSRLTIYDKTGRLEKEVNLPPTITIEGVSSGDSKSELLISYKSFHYPTKIVKYNLEDEQVVPAFKIDSNFESDDYETTQVSYPSKDGTQIPMFLTHKKGLVLNGENPTLLYAYGGYGVNVTPSFSPAQRMWIQSGGIYAVANIRGGGEFGGKWHRSAMFEKKKNSHDDFIAAAEWLIEEEYTNAKKLAIMGGSNGGLLVGVCINQRPELFGAALCLVPVTDMLRFQHFTFGRFWTTEFGNAEENEEHFKFMYQYSPLHNVKKGTEYPPILVSTADCDNRVVPIHAKKFVATLQEAQGGSNPILLRVDKDAGHGLGKPTLKLIEEEADFYSFLFKELDVVIKDK